MGTNLAPSVKSSCSSTSTLAAIIGLTLVGGIGVVAAVGIPTLFSGPPYYSHHKISTPPENPCNTYVVGVQSYDRGLCNGIDKPKS